jgi:hypothetical protein
MAYQNINQYVKSKLYLQPVLQISDISLANDERQYNEEVVFSPLIIGANDGDVLPVKIDLNFSGSSQKIDLPFGEYKRENVIVSENYYNPYDYILDCFSGKSICDIGLTGTDNGLVTGMTGQSISYSEGLLDDSEKFDRLKFDRRLKLFQVTGYTNHPNHRFSGITAETAYEMVSYTANTVGVYNELYGGFYQGFYELFGYNYKILPERYTKGWTVEMTLKPRIYNQYSTPSGKTTLNQYYPNNSGIFFYLGTRAENKYWHFAQGKNPTDPDYDRVTKRLKDLTTCDCTTLNPGYSTNSTSHFDLSVSGATIQVGQDLLWTSGDTCVVYHNELAFLTGNVIGYSAETSSLQFVTTYRVGKGDFQYWIVDKLNFLEYNNSDCYFVYPPTGVTDYHYTESPCCPDEPQVPVAEQDAAYNGMSNALAIRFSGDPTNPKICIRTLTMTGDCITSGSCETTGFESQTGYSINNYCTTKRIYDECSGTTYSLDEHWVLIDVVFERNTALDECDLVYLGGLGVISNLVFTASTDSNSVSLISPPITHYQLNPEKEELVQLNNEWLLEKGFRKGKFKIFVNGKLFETFDNVEEIIPRGLYGHKETQVGVPFNISWGGGTQGLHENLIFSAIPTTDLNYYVQDPELFPPNILSGTSLSALTTNILIEQNFAGTFDGGISSFSMYAKPLTIPEIQHNARILEPKYDFLNAYCFTCLDSTPTATPTNTPFQTPTNTRTPSVTPTNTKTPTVTPTNTKTPTVTPTNTTTPTNSQTPTNTPSNTITQTPTKTVTPTNTPSVTPSQSGFVSYAYTNLGTGGSNPEACSEGGTTFYGIRASFSGLQIGDILYIDTNLNTPTTGFGFVSNGIIYYQIDGGTGEITSISSLC